MSLTEFLLARIAEDETVAKRAPGETWRYEPSQSQPDGSHGVVWGGGWSVASHGALWSGPHIARHDPARVLAECEAKRAIIGVVAGWRHEVVEDCWYTCAAATEERDGGECCDDARRGTGCDCGLDFRVRSVLGPLALPYADHPDYRAEWAEERIAR